MKKLFSLFLFVAFYVTAHAQFGLVTPPCHNDGVLSVTFTGLTPPMTVKWYTQGSTGTIITHTGVAGLTDVLTSYSGGPILVSATDTFGVMDTASYAGAPPFTFYFTSGIAPCPDPDTLTATVIGGTAPFHYSWYNTATSGIMGTVNPITVTSGAVYGVTITDGAGCIYGSLDDPTVIYAYAAPTFFDSLLTTTANCTNGTATAHPYGGGVAPFTYLWSTGATTQTISSLVTGVYYVTITDAIGCTYNDVGYVPQSTLISVPVVPTPTTCLAADGAVIAFGSGGMPPYSFLWSNGSTSASQSGITSGSYNVTVTDANGCVGTGSAYVGASTPISVTYTSTPSLCTSPTGTAILSISGGTLPYSTMWYTTPGQTGATAIALTAGTYSFKVTDAMGCVQTGSAVIPPIDVISTSFLYTPATCTLSNGSITTYPTGGVTPYTYLWSTGTGGASLTGRPAGYYTVTITDNLGCKLFSSAYIPYNSPVGIGATATPATCIFANDGHNTAYAWGGTPPYSFGWSTGGTTSTISALPAGPYWVHATDAMGCTTFNEYSYVGYDSTGTSCYCTIDGTVYYDINGNCTQDPGESGLKNVQIHITGGSTNVYVYTDATGHYSHKVPSGSYTVSETVLAYYPLSTCQLNNVHVTAVAGTGCVNTVDFSNSMDTVHDTHISTWDYIPAVPGHTYSQVTVVSNDGTVPEDSIYVGYKPDGQLYSPSFVPGSYFAGVPYSYNTNSTFSLAPGETKKFYMNYTVPTNIPLNTPVVFKDTTVHNDTADVWTLDNSPWNNVNYFITKTRGSYDPNFKEVNPTGSGAAGTISYTDSILEYMVHFQNTGNYPAENVVVIDTLDDNLDWTSLRPVFQSAQCKVTLMQSGLKKVVKFAFDNINLPDKQSDEIRSNGMFTYTIHIKPGLAVGTQFRNRAAIYFDYNEPVITNTTLNTLGTAGPGVGVTNVSPTAANSFAVYPNPASKNFTAAINSDVAASAKLIVADITGRTMITKTITLQKGSQTIPVDASHLAAGTYFVSVNNGITTQTQKLVIVK